jgi:hypothetical protein
VVSVDKNGKILFRSEPIGGVRCLTTGDFDGAGFKDDIAAPNVGGNIRIFDKARGLVTIIMMKISGEMTDLNEVMAIAAARLSKHSKQDDIVVGGRRGIVACSVSGDILWSYVKWPGKNSSPAVYNLFITDLDGNGLPEVVAGKGSEIFIFANDGTLLDKMAVKGGLDCWKNPGAKMDIADTDNDGKQEIMAVTSEGWFYIFGMAGPEESR